MKENGKRLVKRIVSLALAVVMMASAFAVSVPDEVQAATKEFKMKKNKATVKISDKDAAALADAEEVLWIKYKASKDGFLKVSASENTSAYNYSAGQWQFFSNKKKALTPATTYRTDKTDVYYKTDYFGVKKGTTYYLGVVPLCGVKINAQFVACNDKSGTKKAKSLNLKQKAETQGFVKAGTTNSHWYKFTVTKRQKISITLKTWMTADLTVRITGPGVQTTEFVTKPDQWWGRARTVGTNGAVTPGTYYVEIKPTTKLSTGKYTIKWK